MNITLAEYFQDRLKNNDQVWQGYVGISTLERYYKYFTHVEKPFDACHVPSSRFKPYPIKLIPSLDLVQETIGFIGDKHNLFNEQWSSFNDTRNLYLVNKFTDTIIAGIGDIMDFKEADLTILEEQLVEILKEYIKELPPRAQQVSKSVLKAVPKPEPTPWKKFKTWLKF